MLAGMNYHRPLTLAFSPEDGGEGTSEDDTSRGPPLAHSLTLGRVR